MFSIGSNDNAVIWLMHHETNKTRGIFMFWLYSFVWLHMHQVKWKIELWL